MAGVDGDPAPASGPAAVRIATERMVIRDFAVTNLLSRAASTWLTLVLVSPALFPVALGLRGGAWDVTALLMLLVAGGCAVLLLAVLVTWLWALRPAFAGTGALRVDARALRIQHRQREDLWAYLVDHGSIERGRCVLHLHDGRELSMPAADVPDVEAVLGQLASGDPATAARFPLHRRHLLLRDILVVVYGVLAFMAMLAALAASRDVLFGLFAAGALLGVPLLARKLAGDAAVGTLVVGSDGLRLERGQRVRFLSYGDIDAVRPTPRGLVLELISGRKVRVHLVPPRIFDHTDGRVDALAHRRVIAAHGLICSRMGEYTQACPMPVHVRRPVDGCSAEAWRQAIRDALQALGGTYRAGGLTPVDAAAIACDPRAPRPQRIGAALAVADSSDDDACQRVRIAAGLCADEELRDALEEAARGEAVVAERARTATRSVTPDRSEASRPPPAGTEVS